MRWYKAHSWLLVYIGLRVITTNKHYGLRFFVNKMHLTSLSDGVSQLLENLSTTNFSIIFISNVSIESRVGSLNTSAKPSRIALELQTDHSVALRSQALGSRYHITLLVNSKYAHASLILCPLPRPSHNSSISSRENKTTSKNRTSKLTVSP